MMDSVIGYNFFENNEVNKLYYIAQPNQMWIIKVLALLYFSVSKFSI